jgi:hypothetical protein
MATDADGVSYIYTYDAQGNLVQTKKYGKDGTLLEAKQGVDSSSLPAATQFYLLYAEDKKQAHSRSIAEVRDDIERSLRQEESQRLKQRWIDKLKKKSFIRYF